MTPYILRYRNCTDLYGDKRMAKNTKQTSKRVSALAAHTLSDKNSSTIAKKLAASALSQSRSKNQTGADMEDVASQVMNSSKYSDDTKTLAGSVLSQSNKKR